MIAAIEDSYHLTPIQEGMLFHHLRWPGAGVDIEQIVASLPEDLDIARFSEAWRQVTARHPALRTNFVWQHREVPVQQVWSHVEIPIELQDWSGTDGDAALRQFLAADRAIGFDLAQAPLFRLTIARRGSVSFTVIWTLHHAILDGRSFPDVITEVFEHYEASKGGTPALARPRKSLRQYIDSVHRRDVAAEEGFWRRLLAGFTTPTPLVVGKTVPQWAGEGDQGDVELQLPKETAKRLRGMASIEQLTLNILVQGAWAVVWSRYSDNFDVVFGVTRACRQGETWASVIGPLINTVPVRARIDPSMRVGDWLQTLHQQWQAMRDHERAPLSEIQRWSPLGAGVSLFETLIVFDSNTLEGTLRARGGEWAHRSFRLFEKNSYPLTLVATAGPPFVLRLEFDRRRVDEEAARRLLGHVVTVLDAMAGDPYLLVGELPLLTAVERRLVLETWNRTTREYPKHECVHDQISRQAATTPDRTAVICQRNEITYRELDRRATQLAAHLISLGAGPDIIVGLCVRRSIEMVVGLLAILKAGAAYLPLDPEYPADRLQFMVEDAHTTIVICDRVGAERLRLDHRRLVLLDGPDAVSNAGSASSPNIAISSAHLAYVIYTSGSTGKPKGVMVTHRNVVNFFTAMDDHLGRDPGVWLAVTSLSFDISVLELLWTLARGFTVVVHMGTTQASARATHLTDSRGIEFSLFYFASDEGQDTANRYRLLLEGARFADARGFSAVWTPERHFHAFGGLYPNPSVISAAIAVQTSRVKIRAGSVVLPLHHPARVAEEWAVVDNLSQGRVGISFASGWQPDDFLLRPENYTEAKAIMMRHIDVVRRLWRGEKASFPGPKGRDVTIGTLPRPVQPELPVWITSAGNPDTFRMAGEAGVYVLTHLLGQTLGELKGKLDAYREAWRAAGHKGSPHVTLMLHTFVGDSDEGVREAVREPMKKYLASSVSLIKGVASTFPAFNKVGATTASDVDTLFATLGPEDLDALTEHAFERYYQTGGLFGTVDDCATTIARLKEIGVDEVACLIDFGVDTDAVLASLEHLDALRARTSLPKTDSTTEHSMGAEIERYGVTHLQCTPSLASMLVADPTARPSLSHVKRLLVGGEALSPALASDLLDAVKGSVNNMYGPTETTVWSATWKLDAPAATIPIGRPIANTRLYVLDRRRMPVPVGIPGELYIGGDGVARGYLFRPELTAERFVEDPFVADEARLYRTGDLVRHRPDGALEFLGRLDQQIKIRGHRVELEEIEIALRGQPGVAEAVVIVREAAVNDVRLVGYVIPSAKTTLDANVLREELRKTLPDAMVPSVIAVLPSLPLTPNGKVDRRALPPPDTVAAPRRVVDAPPATRLEEQIAAIWRDVLQLPSVGVDGNFFDLGGHSLLTVHVMTKLRESIGREIPITDMFRFPTIRSLAQHLGEESSGSDVLDRAQARASRRMAMRRRSL